VSNLYRYIGYSLITLLFMRFLKNLIKTSRSTRKWTW